MKIHLDTDTLPGDKFSSTTQQKQSCLYCPEIWHKQIGDDGVGKEANDIMASRSTPSSVATTAGHKLKSVQQK